MPGDGPTLTVDRYRRARARSGAESPACLRLTAESQGKIELCPELIHSVDADILPMTTGRVDETLVRVAHLLSSLPEGGAVSRRRRRRPARVLGATCHERDRLCSLSPDVGKEKRTNAPPWHSTEE
jgi:hypothetical protein